MTIGFGTRLGPYEIVAPLGAGGMGEVYRAKDTRLDRSVAVKIVRSADPERLKRFEREARSASSLNHPNIVTIYDIGSQNGISYIAMELVSGLPLRSVLSPGPLPVRQFLQMGAQIADGLAVAHASGIVHRDLKPENVMVTEDGRVKILDFGLAKLTQPDSSGEGRTQAPTVSWATEERIILGTVGYMSPEQATGGTVDYRSDQFSLGSILYEMATGRRAFQRASAPQTLAAIIQEEPEPIGAINPKVPVPVRWIIERCLAKEAKRRFASTEDLASDLATVRDRLSEATSAVDVSAPATRPSRRMRWIPAVIAAAILVVAGVTVWRLRRADYFWTNPLAGAVFTRLTDWEGSELDARISADGKFVTFLADREGLFDAWVTQVGSGQFLNLTKGQFPELLIDDLPSVGFSDDATQVWLRVTSKVNNPLGGRWTSSVWLVPTLGGTPRPFLSEGNLAVWSPDGNRIVYHTPVPGDPIFVADRTGGNPKQILIDKPGFHNHYPTWSPDGRFVYYTGGIAGIYNMDIWRIPAVGGAPERLTFHRARVEYPTLLDDRTLIYTVYTAASGFALYGLDVQRRIPHVLSSGLEEYLSISADADGRRLVATVANPSRNLWTAPISDRLVDESAVKSFRLPAGRASAPRFGPDYLLYLSSKGAADGLWKLKDNFATELWKGSQGAVTVAPAVSSDGAQIAFAIRGEGQPRLYAMAADGTNVRALHESIVVSDAPSWSPDGKWIAVCGIEGKANSLFKVPADGGPPVRLVEGVTYSPVWSPDGSVIVYTYSLGGATFQVKAVTPDGKPVSFPELWVRGGGNRYRFLPGRRELVVIQGPFRHQDFWLLDLATGNRRQLTKLRPGFETRTFDISPDGKQILFDRYRENSDVVLIDLPPR